VPCRTPTASARAGGGDGEHEDSWVNVAAWISAGRRQRVATIEPTTEEALTGVVPVHGNGTIVGLFSPACYQTRSPEWRGNEF
jgi:hypothetical protein